MLPLADFAGQSILIQIYAPSGFLTTRAKGQGGDLVDVFYEAEWAIQGVMIIPDYEP